MSCFAKSSGIALPLLLALIACGKNIAFQDPPELPTPSGELEEKEAEVKPEARGADQTADAPNEPAGSTEPDSGGSEEPALDDPSQEEGVVPDDTQVNDPTADQQPGSPDSTPSDTPMPDTPLPGSGGSDDPLSPELELINLCRAENTETVTHTIVFDDNGLDTFGCPWGEGDNGDISDGVLTARVEEISDIPLEAGKTLCGFSINSNVETLNYDDELLLTFNDAIVLSSHNYNARFEQIEELSGVFLYEWPQLLGGMNPGPDEEPNPYCLGETACEIPRTSQPGRFALELTGEDGLKMARLAQLQNRAQLKLITTGDDETTDCRHSPITLDLEVIVTK